MTAEERKMSFPKNYRQGYAMLLEYDGTVYKGWQPHPQLPTVGGVLIAAFRRAGVGATPFGASRTDAGVHARAQVASFHSRGDLHPEKLLHQLNEDLPSSMRVLAIRPTVKQFHSHWSSIGKIYRYRISFRGETRAWRLPTARIPITSIDNEGLSRAMERLQSAPEVSAFSNEHNPKPRKLQEARILEISARGTTLEFRASGFGKHQVRHLVSAILGMATGAINENEWYELLAKTRPRPPRADPDGLSLHRVLYPPSLDPFPDADRLCWK